MTMSFVQSVLAALALHVLSVLSARVDGVRAHFERMNQPVEDPFGDMLPPMQGNPVVRAAMRNQIQGAAPPVMPPGVLPPASPEVVMQEERVLASESVVDEQVELNQEERMEVQCVGMEHLREVTTYENEQQEAANEIKSIRSFQPTEAEHNCLPLHLRNKKLPGGLFSDRPTWSNPPPFPERLGEIVVEGVHHTDKKPMGHHVVLELVGCTSCENDRTKEVEWGGLLAIDESGSYRKMYRTSALGRPYDNFGHHHLRFGDRQPIVERPFFRKPGEYPRGWSTRQVPEEQQKYVKTYKYKYSSFKFDSSILPEVRAMAEEAVAGGSNVDAKFVHEHEAEELKVLKELREQEKRIPFNHKLEQMHMHIYLCAEQGEGLVCPDKPAETLMVHDGALAFDSSKTATFDELGKHSGLCTYGHCMSSRGFELKGKVLPWTMCTGCTSDRRCGTHSRAYPHPSMATQNFFNCLVERAYTPTGQVDILQQQEGTRDPKARIGSGFIFRGAESKGHVTGHINWHLTVPREGHCEPFMQDVAYVGIGVDECDKCPGGEVDVDIGMVLLSCRREGTKKLGGASNCEYYDHVNYRHKKESTNYRISEDDRSGEGEGDDEWAFLNLAGLRTSGVTHVMVVANIFGCANGRPNSEIGWQDLEGAFLRVTGSSANSKDFSNAETIGYVDLDAMHGPARNGAALIMFYLSDDASLVKPSEMVRSDAAGGSGSHWKMAVVKKPYEGYELSQRNALKAFGLEVLSTQESSLPEQVSDMSLPTALGTEQSMGPSVELQPVLLDGIAKTNDVHFSQETSEQRRAKEITPQELWKNLAATLPEGPPGTDSFCAKGLQ